MLPAPHLPRHIRVHHHPDQFPEGDLGLPAQHPLEMVGSGFDNLLFQFRNAE